MLLKKFLALATLLLLAACQQAPTPDEVQDTSSTPSIGTFQATAFGPDYFAFRVRLNLPPGAGAQCYIDYGDGSEDDYFDCGPQTVTLLHRYRPDFGPNPTFTATLNAQVYLNNKPRQAANINIPITPACKPGEVSPACHDVQLQGRTTVRIGNPRPYIARFYASNNFPAVQSQQVSFPLTTNFSWVIGDVHADILTCRLDVDGNGTWEYTIPNCDSQDSLFHTYTRAATYTPKLQVLDHRGASFTASFRWGSQNNRAPQIDQFTTLNFSCSGWMGTACLEASSVPSGAIEETFVKSIFDDGDISRLRCTLDPEGDGSFQVPVSCDDWPTNFTYTKRGNYYPRLRVVDGNGFAVEANLLSSFNSQNSQPAFSVMPLNIMLENMPPVIQSFVVSPTQGVAPLRTTSRFTVSDPDGDPLMCILAYGYRDVSTFYQVDGTDLLNCAGIGVTSSSRTASYTFGSTGNEEVHLTVTDMLVSDNIAPSQIRMLQVDPAP